VDGTYLYSAREPVATTTHAVTLTDLQPGTTYTYRVGSAQGTLTTAPRTTIPRFGVDGTRITADGSLFFPVLSYEQCAQTIERARTHHHQQPRFYRGPRRVVVASAPPCLHEHVVDQVLRLLWVAHDAHCQAHHHRRERRVELR
jgi:hypothetical protein